MAPPSCASARRTHTQTRTHAQPRGRRARLLTKRPHTTHTPRPPPPTHSLADFKGYSTGDPKRRVNAGTLLGYVGLFGLVGTAAKIAIDLLSSSSK